MPIPANYYLSTLTAEVLRDLARNESASREVRKAAIELMLERGYEQVNHPELRLYILEINAERAAKEEVLEIVAAQEEEKKEQSDTIDFEPPVGHVKLCQQDSLAFAEGIVDAEKPPKPENPHGIYAGFTTSNMYKDE